MQLDLWQQPENIDLMNENEDFLTQQLITYIGNKRSLLNFIGHGVNIVRQRLNQPKLAIFDVFSGSGVVSRYLKKYAHRLVSNDIEPYAYLINHCYLSNATEVDHKAIEYWFNYLTSQLNDHQLHVGFITELYAPKNLDNINQNERCFYTPRNAMYLDTARQLIDTIPKPLQHYFIAPLLAEASIHANTSGVFKGFYKNSTTGIGQFGGNNKDALTRILGNIHIQKPIFSQFNSVVELHNGNANDIATQVTQVDLAYLDPPYNQHPYGSNYFMLNLLVNNQKPSTISPISGIPNNWYRSAYNKRQQAYESMQDLVQSIDAKYLLISFNSEGFIGLNEMLQLLQGVGKTQVLETKYNTFRGSRNLANRDTHIKEYLYLVEKN